MGHARRAAGVAGRVSDRRGPCRDNAGRRAARPVAARPVAARLQRDRAGLAASRPNPGGARNSKARNSSARNQTAAFLSRRNKRAAAHALR
ncbi:uncharacterized protein AruCF_1860 [Achromobacter ruhlandii]|nr:uncharacterized protein AruCF_1860 [Achromobacter ruhlandii]